MRLAILSLAALALTTSGAAAQSRSPCGEAAVVVSGDSLSEISARCDVGEGRILALNPSVEGSDDLIVGETVRIEGPRTEREPGTLDRLGEIAGSATRDLAESARRAGEAIGTEVDQFLDQNPGIGRRVRDLTGGLSPDAEAQLAVTAVPTGEGPRLSLAAAGLPAGEPVLVTGGRPGRAQERLAEGLTGPDGTFETSVPLPADAGERYRVAVRGVEGGWKATATLARR